MTRFQVRPRAVLACATLALAACATPPDRGPTYTRAGLSSLGTAEIAALFLESAEAGRIERHDIDPPWGGPDTYWGVTLYARPRPIGDDLCERTLFPISLFPLPGRPADVDPAAWPARRERDARLHPIPRLALAPGCREVPGQRFARLADIRTTLEQGVEVLRALAAARAAAAAPGPLPFRLSCLDRTRGGHFECPADLRATLAALALHQAFTLAHQPPPNNCEHSPREEGDAVEIGRPDAGEVWDVRLRHMGTEQAEVVMIRQFPRTQVKC